MKADGNLFIEEPSALHNSYRWIIDGTVQGVGFRPFVFRVASELNLTGWVKNRVGEVEILTQGTAADQEAFGQALVNQAPPLARPQLRCREPVDTELFSDFRILESDATGDSRISVPKDLFMCDDCGAELHTPGNPRFRYPFINCTQCGPRYTLIRSLPYDRGHTSMAPFELCPTCRGEYFDPADRRFHAEPIACPRCGPCLTFQREGTAEVEMEAALRQATAALAEGRIVAVKGIGGYHLLCDATQPLAVDCLRERKHRPHKPLAVMFPLGDDDPLAYLRQEVSVRAEEAALVLSVQRPIVLASRREDSRLPESIAPGLTEVGVFLPYSPLHDLLLGELKRPVVATSGNLSGEPVLTDNADATERLSHIADAFLHHDRPIVRPADDAVYRRVRGKPRPIRLGRGTAPLELTLNRSLQRPVLAVGGHLKNTVALGWENRLVVSPHIGDMGSPRSLAVFEDLVADLPGLYGVSVAEMVCDAHPDYHTARWAKRQQLPLHEVWHHHAHASAAVGWEDPEGDYLVFTWDGVGFGVDGTLWGGEALWGNAGRWQRVGRLKPFRLPGGDQAARQPWRSAASLCWEAAYPVPSDLNVDPLLRAAWEKGVNCPQTSAAGRLFDAATALVGVATEASFEGQAPMRLEATSTASSNYPELPCSQTDSGLWEIDWTPLLPYLTDVTRPVGERAAGFHQAMATALAAQAVHVRSGRPVDAVALSGGVFQNRLLTESAAEKLEASGFEMRFSEAIPVNDAGISAGQILEYAGSPANR